VVENRPGADGVLAADLTAKAAPDGYTLNLVSHSALVVSPAMTKGLTTRCRISRPSHASSSCRTSSRGALAARAQLRELVALAKAKPGTINYASPGPGSAGHLTGELFKRTTGIDWVHVPYKGGARR